MNFNDHLAANFHFDPDWGWFIFLLIIIYWIVEKV